jgi:hypothetical protein
MRNLQFSKSNGLSPKQVAQAINPEQIRPLYFISFYG